MLQVAAGLARYAEIYDVRFKLYNILQRRKRQVSTGHSPSFVTRELVVPATEMY